MTTSVTASTSGSSAASSSTASTASSSQDKFLNLLVAQLKNQDPLNPMDNAQVTSQLAQINTVSGIEKLNSTLQTLLGSYSTTQGMQAASLVGHSVLSAGSSLNLADGAAVGGFDLAGPADQVSITVTGPSGQVVHQATLSNLDTGTHTFQWDGLTDAGVASSPGTYNFAVKAISQGKAVTANTLSFSQVDGITNGSSGTVLNTSTGSVDWANVKQVM